MSETISPCRGGCKTQDHESYIQCLRAASPLIAYTNSANNQDATTQKRWDRELSRYRDLRASGVDPEGTTHRDMDKAERVLNS